MYAETGLFYPYLQNFYQDIQQLEEYCRHQKTNASMSNLIPTSMISEYNIGGEGDLFNAPEPIIEEPFADLDPMKAAISMIDIESIQTEDLFNEVFYGTKNDLIEKANTETPISEILDTKIPVKSNDGISYEENKCLSSPEWIHGPQTGPSFLDYCEMDLGVVYGMRRAYSEGDVKIDQSLLIGGSCITEQRREQLSRYRNKKTKRNFGRKIKKSAC